MPSPPPNSVLGAGTPLQKPKEMRTPSATSSCAGAAPAATGTPSAAPPAVSYPRGILHAHGTEKNAWGALAASLVLDTTSADGRVRGPVVYSTKGGDVIGVAQLDGVAKPNGAVTCRVTTQTAAYDYVGKLTARTFVGKFTKVNAALPLRLGEYGTFDYVVNRIQPAMTVGPVSPKNESAPKEEKTPATTAAAAASNTPAAAAKMSALTKTPGTATKTHAAGSRKAMPPPPKLPITAGEPANPAAAFASGKKPAAVPNAVEPPCAAAKADASPDRTTAAAKVAASLPAGSGVTKGAKRSADALSQSPAAKRRWPAKNAETQTASGGTVLKASDELHVKGRERYGGRESSYTCELRLKLEADGMAIGLAQYHTSWSTVKGWWTADGGVAYELKFGAEPFSFTGKFDGNTLTGTVRSLDTSRDLTGTFKFAVVQGKRA